MLNEIQKILSLIDSTVFSYFSTAVLNVADKTTIIDGWSCVEIMNDSRSSLYQWSFTECVPLHKILTAGDRCFQYQKVTTDHSFKIISDSKIY